MMIFDYFGIADAENITHLASPWRGLQSGPATVGLRNYCQGPESRYKKTELIILRAP
jgi:hypothetical protein